MKKLLFILMSFIGLNASAQDVIVKRNGDELQCKILEVSKNEVKYKRWSNQEGPTFTEKKADIFMLKYENGEKEVVAYESPALTTPVAAPSLTTTTPTEITLADPTPISNVYLEYNCWKRSGIYKWGHLQTTEQTKQLFSNDWLNYEKSRKEDRRGRIFAITGGTLLLGGLGWTVAYIVFCKNYSDAVAERNQHYNDYVDYYNYYYDDDCWYYDDMKFISRFPMLGGIGIGTPMFIVSVIRAKRGHKNATQIVSKYNDEYEKDLKKSSMSKPELNVNSKGNNLAFTLRSCLNFSGKFC